MVSNGTEFPPVHDLIDWRVSAFPSGAHVRGSSERESGEISRLMTVDSASGLHAETRPKTMVTPPFLLDEARRARNYDRGNFDVSRAPVKKEKQTTVGNKSTWQPNSNRKESQRTLACASGREKQKVSEASRRRC